MKFCSLCDNMLYMRSDDNVSLTYYCKNCNFSTVEKGDALSVPITDTVYGAKSTLNIDFNDKGIKHDVTLPRVSNIACKNPNCSRKPEEDNEVIYIKQDPVNLKFVYFCCKCDMFF